MPSSDSSQHWLSRQWARRPRYFNPDVDRYLLTEDDESIVVEVVKHPVTLVVPILKALAGVLCWSLMLSIPGSGAVLGPAGLLLVLWGMYSAHALYMDRFVVTNMRVFRVHGVFTRNLAIMPLARILDTTVNQTFLGGLLNYGHFVFESAAQQQGLREIKFVPDPDKRNHAIQELLRAGIRPIAPTVLTRA